MIILGIESTCDETAAALVEDGRHLLSNVISTSVKAVSYTHLTLPTNSRV